MITIIDIGGNVGSIHNMYKKLKIESVITNSINLIDESDHLILPGVGQFNTGMSRLSTLNDTFSSIIKRKVIRDHTPILGICLGMQLFTKESEEGFLKGFGFIDTSTIKFKTNKKLPHMGWNTIKHNDHPLFDNMPPDERFYFLHSYHVLHDERYTIATTFYDYDFPSAIQYNNVYGVQFHPEKSHKFGMTILKNFSRL